MLHAQVGVANDEVFFASVNCPLTKVRHFSWIALILVMGLLLTFDIEARGASLFSVFLLLVWLVLGFSLELFFRRRLRPGQPLVTLSDEDITVPTLSGSYQQLRWNEIKTISLETFLGRRRIIFILKIWNGRPNKRSFWRDPNQGQPVLSLMPFSPLTQAQLLNAINRRHELAQRRSHEKAHVEMTTSCARRVNRTNSRND